MQQTSVTDRKQKSWEKKDLPANRPIHEKHQIPVPGLHKTAILPGLNHGKTPLTDISKPPDITKSNFFLPERMLFS